MSLHVLDYLDSRIEEIAQDLRNTNSEYALAMGKCKELIKQINPMLHSEKGVTLTAGDCVDFQAFLEHEFTSTAIMQQELYQQGYLDCVKLLKMLGILT